MRTLSFSPAAWQGWKSFCRQFPLIRLYFSADLYYAVDSKSPTGRMGKETDMLDGTRKFSLVDESNKEMKRTLTAVYDALKEKGYNPINQIVGYLLSEDPTYITNHNNARSLICKIDRDELMQELVQFYLDN
jgi:uncharacterized protein (UPF0297 family)